MFQYWITACQCQSKEAFRCLFLKQEKKKQKKKTVVSSHVLVTAKNEKEKYCKFTYSSYG